MNVLAVLHGANVPVGVFGETVAEAGHRLEEWSLAWGAPPPRPVDDYGAVLVLGGSMHADQDDRHPWLREENMLLQRLLAQHVPMLGVCLGVQLIAKAAGAPVFPLRPEPELGWVPVELTAAAADDPVLGRLPDSFEAFEWHYYTYEVPPGGKELARSGACTQAFRLGDAAWGVQFHAEVTLDTIRLWAAENEPCTVEIADESVERIATWNEHGRTICSAFLEVAERAAVAA